MKLLILFLLLCAVWVSAHPGHEHDGLEHAHFHYEDEETDDDRHDQHGNHHGHDHSHGHSHDHSHGHSHSHGHEEEEEDPNELGKVNELTPSNIFKKIDSHDFVVVEFYAPWCGACSKFAPQYEIAAERLKEKAYFGKFDAWNEKYASVTGEYEVSGYPTVYFFIKGDRDGVQYSGDLNADALVDAVERKLRPNFVELSDVEGIKKFAASDRVTIVGFFKDTSSPAYSDFVKVAEKLKEEFFFGVAVNIDGVKSEFGVTEPAAVFFKRYDEGNVILEGDKFSELEDFVYKNKFPLLDEISKENHKLYVDAGIPIAFFFAETQEQRDHFAPILRELAKETRRRVNFIFIDWTKYGNQAKKLALSATKAPCLALEDTKEQLHWAFDETKELTLENIRAWVQQYLAGKLDPTVISQPLPEKNEGPVKVVVGKNFKEIVLDESKDVFVEFYAPWCGHCKSLAPTWEQLGETFASDSSIVIAKMDATENFFDNTTKIHMYPTLKMYRAGDKKNPIQFSEKNKDLNTLVEFVKANSGAVPKAPVEVEQGDDDDDDKKKESQDKHDDDDDDDDKKKESQGKQSGGKRKNDPRKNLTKEQMEERKQRNKIREEERKKRQEEDRKQKWEKTFGKAAKEVKDEL